MHDLGRAGVRSALPDIVDRALGYAKGGCQFAHSPYSARFPYLVSLGARQSPLVPIEVLRLRSVDDAVRQITRLRFPDQVPRVDASLMAFAAIMGGFVFRRRRLAVCQLAHQAVSPAPGSAEFDRTSAALGISTEGPFQAVVALVADVRQQPIVISALAFNAHQVSPVVITTFHSKPAS